MRRHVRICTALHTAQSHLCYKLQIQFNDDLCTSLRRNVPWTYLRNQQSINRTPAKGNTKTHAPLLMLQTSMCLHITYGFINSAPRGSPLSLSAPSLLGIDPTVKPAVESRRPLVNPHGKLVRARHVACNAWCSCLPLPLHIRAAHCGSASVCVLGRVEAQVC